MIKKEKSRSGSQQETHSLGVLIQHPIQYHSPLFRRYNQHPDIDLTAFYCCKRGIESYQSSQMGSVEVKWDIPLLEGYESIFLSNYGVGEPVEDGFFSIVNPSIVKTIIEEELDALSVHGHNFVTYHIAIMVSRIIGVPLFTSSDAHLMLDRPFWKETIRKPLLTLFYKNFDGFLAIGSKNREYFRAHGVPDKKIFNVPYTVDNDFFQSKTLDDEEAREFRIKQGLAPDRNIILYVSKLKERKRPMDLIRAFEQLQGSEVEPQLVFVGDGNQQPRCERYVQSNGLEDDVHFMGFRNQSELPSWYSTGDVFVLPSENEPWAVVINEAMNAGNPIVTTTEVGSAYDLVEDQGTGFMYEPGDIDALSAHLRTILTDDELRERMGRKALERISNWSYDEAVEGMLDALEYVAERD